MPIHILTDEVASQIAAGEVVERPASVVKELLENAIDAGATQIDIRVDGAGKTLIEVADNGAGIPFDQLNLAVARHSTSKLQTAADLVPYSYTGIQGRSAGVNRVSVANDNHLAKFRATERWTNRCGWWENKSTSGSGRSCRDGCKGCRFVLQHSSQIKIPQKRPD